MTTTATAPGKIILFGEHAVVYRRPALAVPVEDIQATATVSKLMAVPGEIQIEAPGIGLSSSLAALRSDHPLAAAIKGTLSALSISRPPACTVRVASTIPVAAGLGSGAAVSVAIIRALSGFLGNPLPDDKVNSLAFEVERLHHGTPSGIDNTVVCYRKPVYFVKGMPLEFVRIGWPFVVVIGDTGIPSPTKDTVGDVRRAWDSNPEKLEKIFDQIAIVVQEARQAIECGNISALGPLMDENHALLKELGVSSLELDRLAEAARGSGAQGAKLSGSGRGGNMIALVDMADADRVAQTLKSYGARRTTICRIG
jgi:mevalonate kinase